METLTRGVQALVVSARSPTCEGDAEAAALKLLVGGTQNSYALYDLDDSLTYLHA